VAIFAAPKVPAYSASCTEEQTTDDWNAGGMDGDGRVHKARVAKTTEMVEGAGYAAGVGAREIGSVRHHAELHVGGVEHLPPITVGGHEAEQSLQSGHGREGSLGLSAGESTGSGEHPPIDTPPVIQEVADGDLQVLFLAQGGWGGRAGGRALRGRGAKVGRCVLCTLLGSMPA
jgi:hypothetical protein